MARRDILHGYLVHISHYDPWWIERKAREKPFDIKVGLEVVDALADNGFNALLIDFKDGMKYKSHPELKRHYSVPSATVQKMIDRAHKHGMDVVPKLNFSQSHLHQHNTWFRPYNGLFDNKEYWRRAFKIIDEVKRMCRPKKYLHIGMDEDHDRSVKQYVEAIKTLRKGLRKRKLRPVMWNDTATRYSAAMVHVEKSLAAEDAVPKDVVHVVWDYAYVQPKILSRLRKKGFDFWIAPGRNEKLIKGWNKALKQYGGSGTVMTHWKPCRKDFRRELISHIKKYGKLYNS